MITTMKPMTGAVLGISMLAAFSFTVSGCATMSDAEIAKQAADVLRASFNERGQAKLERLNQDEPQALCSVSDGKPLAKDVLEKIEKSQLALIKYPADGKIGRASCRERV